MRIKHKNFITTLVVLLLSAVFFYALKTYIPKDFLAFKKPEVQETKDSLFMKAFKKRDTIENSSKNRDSLAAQKKRDSLNKNSQKQKDFSPVFSNLVSKTDSSFTSPLTHFFRALKALENNNKRRVRIGYFGDSMIDGDLIVQQIRQRFQEKYGGRGIGFIPMTSASANTRATVYHRFSDNWKKHSFMTGKKAEKPYGISGEFFYPDSSESWVQLKKGHFKKELPLYRPVLYYGQNDHPTNKKLEIFADKDSIVKSIAPEGALNQTVLARGQVDDLKINFKNMDSIPFYGISSGSRHGVMVDKFSSRGNSGLPLYILSNDILKKFNNRLDYDLIVLHFGPNVIQHNVTNYGWYGKRMERVLAHLKKSFPHTSFLVVSTADKASKYGTEMQTDSAVVPLVRAQKNYAKNSGAGFVNFYALMGGRGSIVHWVEHDPGWANKDYTHFNRRGSNKIGDLLFKNIEREFDKFKTHKAP